jgi:hypothetical protein
MSGIIKGTVLLRIITWFGYVCPAVVRIGEIRNKELWRLSELICLFQLNV